MLVFLTAFFVLGFAASASGAVSVDFRQSANNETNGAITGLGNIHWIGSIVQSSNSVYYEGMGNLQRTVFTEIPATTGDVHTLTFRHQATKAGIHAYDFLTSWEQARLDDEALLGVAYSMNECGEEIGPPHDLDTICQALHGASGYFIDVEVPDDPYVSKDGSTASRIAAYEAVRGNRTIRVYGNAPISSGSMTVSHDVAPGGDTGDSFAEYVLTVNTTSTQLVIEMSGHLALGGDPAFNPMAWGIGLGSSDISGGPYHFKLEGLGGELDGNGDQTEYISLGSQDNQIKGADILRLPPICDVTPSSDAVCVGGSATFTDNSTGGTPPYSYCWEKEPYGSGCLSSTNELVISSATLADDGNYRVIVTDFAGLSDTCYASLTVNPPPALICTGDEITCDNPLATASVSSTPSTGVSYAWSPAPVSGQGTATAMYNTPGTKKVVVTVDATGCVDSCEATITQDLTKPVLICTGDEITCDHPIATVSVSSTPSTGVSYTWSPAPLTGQGTDTATYDAAGSKKVVVEYDATGCVDSCNAVVTEDLTKPSLVCTGDEITCDNPVATVSVSSTPSSGVSYTWSPSPLTGQGTSTATYDAPGFKKVVVEYDATGCRDSCNAEVTQDLTKPSLTCSGDELTCDSTLASATVVSDPSVGVSYVWSPEPVSGQGTAHARYNTSGMKKVVVEYDATGCRDSCEAEITQDTSLPELSCSGDELTCDSLMASATVTSDPSVGVSYAWSPAPVSGQGTDHARYDAPGMKKVVVTIVASGCKDSCEAEITEDLSTPELTCEGDELTCDSTLASATVVSDPSEGVSFAWEPAPVSGQGTAHARYDAPGTKKVIVTLLSTGCKDTCEVEITQDVAKPSCSLSAPDPVPPCGTGGHNLTATTDGDIGSHDWSLVAGGGDGWAITQDTGTNSITYSTGNPGTTGTFRLVLTGTNGCKDSCEVTFGCEPPGEFCTFTMGGWGSGCPSPQQGDSLSTQPGCIRDHYFARVFPTGVMIGDPAGLDGGLYFAAKWNSASAVEDFLPAGKKPQSLDQDHTDPIVTNAGVLAGQLLALTLNVGYSCEPTVFDDLALTTAVGCYGLFEIPDSCGKFSGITVDSFLVVANWAVAGMTSVLEPFSANLSDVNFTATCLNEAFNNCDPFRDAIFQIPEPYFRDQGSAVDETPSPKKFAVGQSYPNPFNPSATISFALPSDGRVFIEVYDIVGRKVITLLDGQKSAGYHSVSWYGKDSYGRPVASGVYFCRVQYEDEADVQKMILLR
jgi:hypothetical protein